jgi:hypothetical protein
LPQQHEPVITIKIGDEQHITSGDTEQEYGGVDCNIVPIHQLADMQQVFKYSTHNFFDIEETPLHTINRVIYAL